VACARRLLDITFGVAIFALLLLILFLRLVTRMPDLDDIDG
jgi:hypothetical protein